MRNVFLRFRARVQQRRSCTCLAFRAHSFYILLRFTISSLFRRADEFLSAMIDDKINDRNDDFERETFRRSRFERTLFSIPDILFPSLSPSNKDRNSKRMFLERIGIWRVVFIGRKFIASSKFDHFVGGRGSR